ncbi:MAG: 30S ribosomal protein S17 [Candidatus Buchananbacteria bacterium RIFCSPHIGHO2_02_FULL_40_13]|uniref:Small ribosomal subunit protein uS17 n=1 Tax=Candidatus Buchananbacteria bacterium RIFCSPLOWO2_01_FULL_39_33 TaxID=1797543 RepID=A0A1G1YL19_9BACT|nr:MAG: 30S ribosomal protein S17 [Candidatus Buchananbacteria bacterium RIFCSPHIGHO2_01_FULL_40_35]OGY50577.1 MAG: 30S ribosomal protein S17 [Candidatus Buchananbacteria bacterium RIFCSPHIGHO2_02_FULL_40_13]OGY53048.1 MAG: 30S ribosomal protein S17 [Candidatus Buchananbacteria bacterium RIFCSPLOWO2_01_FULL_39_33]
MAKEKPVIKRKLKGEVISDKMEKTVVVRVDRFKLHPTYQKRFKVSKKYQAHDPKNQFKIGDSVEIIESRPLSQAKRWRVIYK